MVRTETLRILIVDDHAIVREGLKQILVDAATEFEVGEASTGQECLQRLRAESWNALVLDISLPDRSGLDLLKQIRNYYPDLPLLVLTMHAEEQYALRVLRAGAAGFLTKESAPEQMVTAVTRVASGGRYVSPKLAELLAFDLAHLNEEPHQSLSDREFEVLCMIASGERIKDIAEKLCLSVKTVSSHRARILSKMRMKSNADLIRYMLEHDMLPQLHI